LTLFPAKTYNPLNTQWFEEGFMKGSILCAKCGRKMDEDTGTCPRCYVSSEEGTPGKKKTPEKK
jgi:predicted amidophosphoribosyltransferase